MKLRTLIAASALAVSACSQGFDDNSRKSASTENPSEVASTATAAAAAQALGKAVSGAQARKVLHDRHEGMEATGDAMKLVSGELKKDNPDLAKVRGGAATFARYAPQVKGWYPPGTGPDAGKTRAKPEIWQKPQDFRAKAVQFERAAQAFNAAARGTSLAAIRAAHADVGKACKACHEPYRAPEE